MHTLQLEQLPRKRGARLVRLKADTPIRPVRLEADTPIS